MQGLTPRQADMLALLKRSPLTPSFEEMQSALGLSSKSGVHRLITALEERGFIARIRNRARAIQVLDTPKSWDRHALAQFTDDDLMNELRNRAERRPQ